jgi:hypothetical protein
MSPGSATTNVPPAFGVPVAGVAGAADWDGVTDAGACVAGPGVAGPGVGDAAPPHAATAIAVAAASAANL